MQKSGLDTDSTNCAQPAPVKAQDLGRNTLNEYCLKREAGVGKRTSQLIAAGQTPLQIPTGAKFKILIQRFQQCKLVMDGSLVFRIGQGEKKLLIQLVCLPYNIRVCFVLQLLLQALNPARHHSPH